MQLFDSSSLSSIDLNGWNCWLILYFCKFFWQKMDLLLLVKAVQENDPNTADALEHIKLSI